MLRTILDAVGQTYKDFAITKYLPLKELQSSLIELVHKPTGARIMHIANSDPENLFCLSFQTLPYNSNGVAHILEHTVLCGSEKFPVKDPFFAMTRRSLNTYMNALTGQDFTCYPASSQVEKDFYNLLDVYLDSVFHPQLKMLSFLQEGHRLEIVDHRLEFQGIVYNEMKGAMSSVESRLWEALSKRLVPDLPYAYNSGGSPKEILSLTYEQLLEFHQEFYHPSRCLFFFYGNLPLVKHLDFIEKELGRAQKITPLPPLKLQPRFENPVRAIDFYPAQEGEDAKSLISFAWLTVPISHQSDILALEVINTILTDTDASPLTKALLKSGLCTDLDSSLDIEMSEIPWVITCKGCDEKNADKLEKILFEALQKMVFNQEEVEAALHQLEFERMEIGADGGPFGLTLFMRACLIKQHGCEPENALLIHSLFDELRDKIKDPKYLPNLLKKYAIENPHFVRLVLKPDPLLNSKEQQEEQATLEKIRSRLEDVEIKALQEQSIELKTYQEALEHQSIECLPKVTLKDVPTHIRDYPLQQNGNCYFHSCFTNQILYADLIFDLPEIQAEDLTLLALFARILPELGCGGRSYEENLAFQQRYVGGFEASLALHTTYENPDICKPTFTLRGKALYRNADKLFQLISDFVTRPNFTEKARIQEWLSQHATEQKERLNRASMSYAVQNSLKGLSIPSFIHEKWNGLSYHKSVMEWEKKFDIRSLKRMGDLVLGLQNHKWVFTSDVFPDIKMPELPNKSYQTWKGKYQIPKPASHASFIAAPIAFTALGLRTVSYNSPDSADLLIASELMKNVFLHKEIREKGGAYGAGASYTPSSGNFHFYAYRDPNLKRSVDAFYKAADTIAHKKFSERELEEAKLGVLQTLDAPVSPGSRGIVAYSWQRAGRTKELRERFRAQVLQAGSEDVANAVSKHLTGHEGVLVSFLGKELYEKEEKNLTKPLTVLPIV